MFPVDTSDQSLGVRVKKKKPAKKSHRCASAPAQHVITRPDIWLNEKSGHSITPVSLNTSYFPLSVQHLSENDFDFNLERKLDVRKE